MIRTAEQARHMRERRTDLARLPTAPLAAFLAGRPLLELLGCNLRTSWYRARARGSASLVLIDRICVEGLGLHPAEIYGEMWWGVSVDRAFS